MADKRLLRSAVLGRICAGKTPGACAIVAAVRCCLFAVVIAVVMGPAELAGLRGAGQPGLAHAGDRDDDDDARARLARGESLFDDQEYKRAIRVMSRVARDRATTRSQRLRALEIIGLSRIILGHERRAEEAFWQVLEIDPRHELREDFGSAKIREVFDRVKRGYFPARLEHRAPESVTGGAAVDIAVRVATGVDVIKGVRVMAREEGAEDYRVWRLRPSGGARWRGQVVAPPSRQPYELEYYIEGLDLGGRVAAIIAAPSAPLSVSAGAGGVAAKATTPWYRRWYTVAGAGALVGFGTALVITSVR